MNLIISKNSCEKNSCGKYWCFLELRLLAPDTLTCQWNEISKTALFVKIRLEKDRKMVLKVSVFFETFLGLIHSQVVLVLLTQKSKFHESHHRYTDSWSIEASTQFEKKKKRKIGPALHSAPKITCIVTSNHPRGIRNVNKLWWFIKGLYNRTNVLFVELLFFLVYSLLCAICVMFSFAMYVVQYVPMTATLPEF